MKPDARSFPEKWYKDREGHVSLVSRPNLPLIVWFVGMAASWPAGGKLQTLLQVISHGALFAWAWLELFQGLNYTRRAMGLIVLGYLVYSATTYNSFM